MLAAISVAALGLLLTPLAPRPATEAAPRHASPACRVAQLPLRPAIATRLVPPMMVEVDNAFFDEYVQTDPATGERTPLELGEKERIYLECLDSYYNEGGKQLLPDDEYEQLKSDLNFEGASITTLSKDEIQFVLANKRFKMGKPVMNDGEYDALRKRLKEAGSKVIIHDAAACNLDTGVCKADLRVDEAKQRLLYIPGTSLGLLLGCEVLFWTVHTDPLISILISALPAYFFGAWFTENIFAQKPLVTTAACPQCNVLLTTYFGDLFNVATDKFIPNAPLPGDTVEFDCPECKSALTADRSQMIIFGAPKK